MSFCILQINCNSERWNIRLCFHRRNKQQQSGAKRDSSGDATEKPLAMSNCAVSEKVLKQNIPCAWHQCLKLKYCVLMPFQSKPEGRGENINEWLEKEGTCVGCCWIWWKKSKQEGSHFIVIYVYVDCIKCSMTEDVLASFHLWVLFVVIWRWIAKNYRSLTSAYTVS